MNLYILNQEFAIVDIIDTFTSLIWNHAFYGYGDFELYTKCNAAFIQSLRKDYYIVRECDILRNGDVIEGFQNVMIIEDFQIQTDVENGDYLIVVGFGLKHLVTRRVVENQTNMSGYVHSCIKQLLNENVINPTNSARKIEGFVFSDEYATTQTMSRQATGDNLGDLIIEICQNFRIGWDIVIKNNQYIFVLYDGIDHSYNQSANNYVVFSREFDNLLSSDYTEKNSEMKNVAIVAGEGEGLQRKKITVGNATGLDRREMWVDSRNSSTNDGQISDVDYYKMLTQEGEEAIAEQSATTSFTGEADTTKTYILHNDFDLGDIVEVVNDYGIHCAARITEIVESIDENGTNVLPTFQYEGS